MDRMTTETTAAGRAEVRPLSPGDGRLPGQDFDTMCHLWGAHERPGVEHERFALVTDDGVVSVHMGRGMSLARVLAFEASTDDDETGLSEHDSPYDLVVFDGRGIARAIIRRAPGVPDTVRILD